MRRRDAREIASTGGDGNINQRVMDSDAVFIDCGLTVTIDLALPKGTPARDIRISGGADSLVVRVGGDLIVPPLFSVVQLYSTVSPEDTRTVSPVEGRLLITLRKLDSNLHWPSLEVPDEPQVWLLFPSYPWTLPPMSDQIGKKRRRKPF